MTLVIEISVDIIKIKSFTNIIKYINQLIENYIPNYSHSHNETKGIGKQFLENKLIYTLYFEEISENNLIALKKDINKNKHTCIENLYYI